MKKLFCLFFILLNGICFAADPISFVDTVKADQTRLLKDLKFLINSTVARNNENIARLNACADYIFKEFSKLTSKVEEQKYLVGGKEYKNIICSLGPADGERIIVGAHYDVCGNQPGSDDNASGVSGLLETARILKLQEGQLRCRIDFVAYSLEEPPNFRTENMGSAVHAKMLHEQKIKVKTMICLEMIGFFSDKPRSQQYPIGIMKLFYPRKANFIAVIGKTGQGKTTRRIKRKMNESSEVKVISLNAPASVPGIDFSDHLNYWKYGYVAVMITDTSFYRNANYHEQSDTLETLNIEKMAEVINGVVNSITNLK